MIISEKGFEDTIERDLINKCGYTKRITDEYSISLGLMENVVFEFIEKTQAEIWKKLVSRGYSGETAAARTGFIKRLAKEISSRGTVDVLRHGVIDLGIEIRLAYFKPAHELSSDVNERFAMNEISIVRQFKYEENSNKSIDLAIFVNGLLTATAELKNPLTGQTTENAIAQYRDDRDPKNLTLSKRAIVHFAVDPDTVSMTTKLDGAKTKFFPFNQGSRGPGVAGLGGNPPNSISYRTEYLWLEIWQKDNWLDLLQRFVHVDFIKSPVQSADSKMIFPRFHQWHAVTSLEREVLENGVGKNYLIQHSAGSGKSNTIAWLSHRLAYLHNSNSKVFDKVIVITDRRILDKQLQETIYQFEHKKGVVEKIDKNSDQLAEALTDEKSKIIISTLQKFPFVLSKIAELDRKNYAVIIDEAHSSQTGKSAKDLRAALGKGQTEIDALSEAEEIQTANDLEDEDAFDSVVRSIVGRGKQSNLSFFAFTATPKGATLEMFGKLELIGDRSVFVPNHVYSMKQAIDEEFIFDVLKNYTTYKTYWKIEKKVLEDPELDSNAAKRSIARFIELHPTNLAQKAEIIVEHFRTHTSKKINGKAKAMVVTSSRLHAVKYKIAIDLYISENKYSDLSTLVAFSGKVIDEPSNFTEASMNGFPESETAEKFDTQDYQVLIVAEKFQTGFDQPLLHTMYVDKPLKGLNAVQTLCRINRRADFKIDTFILDFRNEKDDISKYFSPWYEQSEAEVTDPNLLWDAHKTLILNPIIREEEIKEAVNEILAGSKIANHNRVYGLLDPCLTRYLEANEDEQKEFKSQVLNFTNLYSYISQIVDFVDVNLERDFVYSRALASRLPSDGITKVDIGSDLVLTHLKIERAFEGHVDIATPNNPLKPIREVGAGSIDTNSEHLSTIIEELNKRFGLNLTESDQLLFDQFEQTWLSDPEVTAQAQNNEFENFRLVFDRKFLTTVIGRMDENDLIFKKILDEPAFQQTLMDLYASKVYIRANAT